MDKEYTKGFRKICYERNSALPEGADCCEYRLHFDKEKVSIQKEHAWTAFLLRRSPHKKTVLCDAPSSTEQLQEK